MSKKAPKTQNSDSKKESLFKELSALLREAGYQVRREALKRGHGFKVLSGSCRANADKLIFVDRRLTQDEQLSFLVNAVASLGLQVKEDRIAEFPGFLAQRLRPQAAL